MKLKALVGMNDPPQAYPSPDLELVPMPQQNVANQADMEMRR